MITPEDLNTQTAYDLIVARSVHELFDALMIEIAGLKTRISDLEAR